LGAATEEAQLSVATEIAELVADYLNDGVIRNALNVPSVSAETLKVLGPYLSLAEKLGSLQGQLAESIPVEVQIEYCGEISHFDVKPLTVSVLKALLTPMLEDVSVNYVNAPVIAKDRGIKVVESRVSEHADFTSLLKVTTRRKDVQRTISGTIFGHAHPRIVQIDHFYLEAIPEGTLLYVHNEDQPGVIGNVGTLLGQNGVNISRMQLGLNSTTSEAVALYSIDKPLTADLFKKLVKLPHIISAKQLEL
jgi:D-3-phosphoglycerate dehydrogenase